MAINPNADFNELTTWLNQNLLSTNSFVPHADAIPHVKSKGIYFWFMRQDGYKAMSNYVTINPIEPKYSRDIEGLKYDLVYLGTAGTGKKGKSNLNERFEWHVNQNHTESNICYGTLSTLRAGLGALLSYDLILPNTENQVNDFMKHYMKVFWIEYSDGKTLIDNDEKILIKEIRPLLNLKNNPNARANVIANSTQVYKIRRVEIYNNTRLRLGCKGESEQSKKTNKTPTKDSPSFEHQVYSDENTCIEFFVYKNQSILEVVRGIEGLPKEACSFEILNSKTGLLVSEFKGWKSTGKNVYKNPTAQNIYTYFSAIGGKIEGKEAARWIHIQNRMNKINDEIEEITIRVCSLQNITDTKTNISRITPSKTKNIDIEIENLILSKKFKVVMVCAGRKNNSFFTSYPDDNFVNKSNQPNEHHPDKKMENKKISWREYLLNNQNDKNLLEAYNLYTRNEYRSLYRKYNNDFYILSAGWGLVNSEFKLPKYNITFSNGDNQTTKRNDNLIGAPYYKDFSQMNINGEEDIVYIGSPYYLPLFFQLTQNLKNRKIIYWKKSNTPLNYPIPNSTFVYKFYHTNTRTNWHYELAEKIANGIIP
jgi:hypothetical protein